MKKVFIAILVGAFCLSAAGAYAQQTKEAKSDSTQLELQRLKKENQELNDRLTSLENAIKAQDKEKQQADLAKRRAAEAAKRKKAAEAAKQKKAAEAKRKAEEEAKQKKAAEEKRKAEEAKRKADILQKTGLTEEELVRRLKSGEIVVCAVVEEGENRPTKVAIKDIIEGIRSGAIVINSHSNSCTTAQAASTLQPYYKDMDTQKACQSFEMCDQWARDMYTNFKKYENRHFQVTKVEFFPFYRLNNWGGGSHMKKVYLSTNLFPSDVCEFVYTNDKITSINLPKPYVTYMKMFGLY